MPKPESLSINERYEQALQIFNDMQFIKHNELTEENIKIYTIIKRDLSRVLLFGKTDACSGIAHILKQGLAVYESDYGYKLFLSIGSKLGNSACAKKLPTLSNIGEVEKEATIWVNVIRNNTKNHDVKIPIEEIADTHTKLEKALATNSIDLTLLENCFDIAKSKVDYSSSVEVSVHHDPLSQEKKYEVKHIGGVKEKEGYEIS